MLSPQKNPYDFSLDIANNVAEDVADGWSQESQNNNNYNSNQNKN
jgi:hypothetical protein